MPATFTPAQVRQAFMEQLGGARFEPDAQAFWGADPQYYLPSRQQLTLFLQHNIHFKNTGMGTGFDCDDYAYAVKGLIGVWNLQRDRVTASWCVGVIFGRFAWMPGAHAANWFIDAKGTITLIEPQFQSFHGVDECTGGVKLVLL